MKTKDLLTITTVALGTAALTVAAFLPNPLEAGSEANSPAPTLPTPRLVANGIEMTLAPAENRDFKAGEPPAFELKAVNTAAKPAQVFVRITLSASAPVTKFSRTLSMPSVLWYEEQSLTLGPRETKAIAIAARTNLPVNRDFSVSLAQVDRPGQAMAAGPGTTPDVARLQLLTPGIVALRFSTATPQPAPALAASTQLVLQDNAAVRGRSEIPLTP